MNGFYFNNNHSIARRIKRFFDARVISRIMLPTLLVSFLLMTPAQASQSSIKIADNWVEDGFLFHVTFKYQPAKTRCALDGEGLIEFEVVYDAQTSSGTQSAFGVATWSPGSDADDWIETQGKAIGSQALCTTFSPCRIQQVNIVKAWCPVDGPLFLK